MKMPKISIIMPNYNGGFFLDNAIRSIAAQTFGDWECIVIDDCSTDDSRAIIRRRARRDKRFRLIEMPANRGSAAARNAGLDAARGEWVMFLDSDDFFHTAAAEWLIKTAESAGADLAAGATAFVPFNSEFIANKRPPPLLPSIFCGGFNENWRGIVSGGLPDNFRWMWIFRYIFQRKLIGATRFDERMKSVGDDMAFMMDIFHKSKKLAIIPNEVVYHRSPAFGASASSSSMLNYGPGKILFFPILMGRIALDWAEKYPGEMIALMRDGWLNYAYHELVAKPVMFGKCKAEAAGILRQMFRARPSYMRRMPFRKRLRAWAFMKIYGRKDD